MVSAGMLKERHVFVLPGLVNTPYKGMPHHLGTPWEKLRMQVADFTP